MTDTSLPLPASAPVIGCDFTSSPSHRKPVVLAIGRWQPGVVSLDRLVALTNWADFETWLRQQEPCVGAFDLPFGLPRELVEHLGWPQDWLSCLRHYAGLSRADIRAVFSAFCAARPVGAKLAHRATDGPAGSSPSMKWVNPPVAYMLHAGVPRLIDAGWRLPGLHAGLTEGLPRIALEAYPGLLARELIGRVSYKSDDGARQNTERLIARKNLLTALEAGRTRLGLRLRLTHAQRESLVDDARGDRLDAVLCMVQAGWAQSRHQQGDARFGLPVTLDPLEGWIVSA
ncbi:MAG: DUF429 domain-containing protein [Rhodoferax sp.]|nr:DUF429 domain-containing protein [Rhodoferax sp.]